jgi:ankyrin repeat protein
MLIEAGFSPRATSSKEGSWPGWNAMHWAVAGPNYEIVEALLRKDLELLKIPTDYENKDLPLHIAAQASYGLEMVKLLLTLGADPCAEAGYGQTALSNCIGEFRLQLDMARLELLLKANSVNGYVVQSGGITILHLASLRAARLDMEELPGHELLRWLLQRVEIRELVNKKNDNGITPLHLVCYRPDYASIRLLVEAGADVNCLTSEPNGMSPIGIALEYARAPQPGWAAKDLDSVWHKAAFRAACYLSDKMAGTPEDKNFSRLHIAAYCSYVGEVKRLVETENADLESRNAKGFTPLEMLAALLLRYVQTQTPIDPRYLARAKEIINYLNDWLHKRENSAQA